MRANGRRRARSERSVVSVWSAVLLVLALYVAGSFYTYAPVRGQQSGPRTDFGVWTEPVSPTLPSAGGYVFDPDTGVKILRVTDQHTSNGDNFGTIYSNWHTFNKDNTRILFSNEHQPWIADFDPTTFTVSNRRILPFYNGNTTPTEDGAAWSYMNPNILYTVVGGSKLVYYDFSTESYGPTPIADFTTFSVTGLDLGPNGIQSMHMDAHDEMFIFRVTDRVNGAEKGYFVYKRSTNSILFYRANNDVHHVLIDRSGRYAVAKYNTQVADQPNSTIIDLQASPITFTDLVDGAPDQSPGGHGDVGTGTIIGAAHNIDTYTFRSLAAPHSYVNTLAFGSTDVPRDPRIPGSGWQPATHISMLADDEQSALYEFYACDTTKPFCDELAQVANTQTPSVRRLLHHYSVYHEYIDSPRATISRDGRFIAFTSNWGDSGRRDLFIAAIPQATQRPAAPSCLRMTAVDTSGYYVLSWVDNANNETGFEIEQGSLKLGTFSTLVTVPANVTSYRVAKGATSYDYFVRAVNASGTSKASNTTCAACLASSSCKAVKGTMWTALNNATLDAEGGVAKYLASPNSAASSVEKLLSGEGYFEFSPNTNGSGSNQLDVYLQDGGNAPNVFDLKISQGYVSVYENGAYRADTGFVVGDLLKIGVETVNGVKAVRYYKNNVPIWTSSLVVTYPLDVHFETGWDAAAGKGLTSATLLGFGSVLPATWTDVVNATAMDGGAITKNAGGYWKGSADTTQLLTGDGYVEYTINNTGAPSTYAMSAGFNSGDLTALEYYWAVSEGWADVRDGQYEASTTVAVGDRLRVAIEGGIVRFYKNGELIYTSTVTPSYPLQGYWDSPVDGGGLTSAVVGTN